MREKMMGQSGGLGVLSVGESGNEGLGVLCCQPENGLDKAGLPFHEKEHLLSQRKADAGGHLVVSGPPGMNPSSFRSHLIPDIGLDGLMHVFSRPQGLRPLIHQLIYCAQNLGADLPGYEILLF